ncbi:hypothetical protein BGL34_01285 [Fructilactobacillus lindneri]|uniref:Uncharacterized protein n=3 Tax=Fructilactobacillus lindneri TaxID=53444 RepID=A0A0R2JPE4_9LACO|nr:DUF5590 domain-containing protein [Fructilactobacillus lindneri]ANZ58193.1 hypothetical protein AYR60_05300 [Fructilactobacillus lindneri]ANZ59514.1 hypothetical protein AYR59_05555 [Fructilactobacillus lindneri]KRN79017.1 hypothetical protein IV52_GL000422 [Fructilactobacillus lindneri DSM 20690 = JCM 11027]POG98702.1 hypothetical protein BGL31_01875 [Fructilactobacillus lindneri]POH04090.1 hypothetical protein BGL32_01815 [Fructilactobacillus lindneri]
MRKKWIRRKKLMKIFEILVIFLIFLLIMAVMIIHQAKEPQIKTKRTTINLVEKHAKFHGINEFYTSNLGKTYYSVSGYNQDGKPAYAIVSKNWENIQVIKHDDGISSNKAKNIALDGNKNKKVTNVGLSLLKNKPVWIVSMSSKDHHMSYSIINFYNGRVISKINNI